MEIKTEKWGKRKVVVARDKGKLISWATLKNLEEQRNIFKSNGTFREDVKRTKLTNVSEYVVKKTKDKPIRKRQIRARFYQYYFSAEYKGKEVAARSQQRPITTPIRVLRDEALNNFNMEMAEVVTGTYDADDFNFKEQEGIKNLREGVVYYR